MIGVDTCAADARAHAPRAEHRLVRRVLVEVDEHPAARAPPSTTAAVISVGVAALELAGEGHRGGPHLVAVPPRLERDVEVQAPRARRLDVRLDAELVEQVVDEHGRPPAAASNSMPGDGSRSMRSSSATSRSGSRFGHTWNPRQPWFTRPQQVGEVGGDERVAGGAVRRRHDGGGEPVGRRLRHPLLEERLAAGALRVALEQHRPVARPSRISGSATAR